MREKKPDIKFENQQGFSLLETAIALIIMMVVTLGTASLYVYATNYNAGTGDRAASLAIAQQKMERLRRAEFSDSLMAAGTTSEDVTYVNRHYTLTCTICNTSSCGGSSTRKMITIQVVPQGNQAWVNTPITLISERDTTAVGDYAAY